MGAEHMVEIGAVLTIDVAAFVGGEALTAMNYLNGSCCEADLGLFSDQGVWH